MQITKGKQPKPLKAVIYGPEGVGKSSLAKDFPKPLFIDVEGGTARLDVARTPRPTSWAHLKQLLGDLARDPMGYQTLVIDTGDWAEKLAIKQICAEQGIAGLGETSDGKKDYGKSYGFLDRIWSDFLTQLEADFIDAGKMNVVILGHSTTRKFELPEESGQFDRYEVATTKKSAETLRAWADMVLFCNYQTLVLWDEKTKKHSAQGGSRRMMYAEHTAAFDAKNRDGLPREMDLSIEPLRRCFIPLGAAPVATPAPVVAPVATPAPVAAPAAAPAPAVLTPTHQALIKLMADSNVTYDQVLAVMVARGRAAKETPLENLPVDFINGWVLVNWSKITEMITTANLDNPAPNANAAA